MIEYPIIFKKQPNVSPASKSLEPLLRESAPSYEASINELQSKLLETGGNSEFSRRMHRVIPLASYNEKELAVQIEQYMAGFIDICPNTDGSPEQKPGATLLLLDVFWDKDKEMLFDSFATGQYHDRSMTQVLLGVNPGNPNAVSIVFVEKIGKGSSTERIVTTVDFAFPQSDEAKQVSSGITLFPFDPEQNEIREVRNTTFLPSELGLPQQGRGVIACIRTHTLHGTRFEDSTPGEYDEPVAIHMNPLMEVPPQHNARQLERYYKSLAYGKTVFLSLEN